MNYTKSWKHSLSALALGLAALSFGVGCAGTPVPHERVASSAAAIRAAQEVGAANQPQAELHLKLARDQAERAKALIESGDNERAVLVLMRAEADAELAIVLAKESTARAEAQQAMAQVQTLKQRTP
jgi:hypothetical protein